MSGAPTNVPFLDAAAGRPASHTPVWFMRQAGRSLPEYRALRGEGSILDAIKNVDLSVELTLQPVRRYGVDAAVLYSDIVVPAHAVGFGIDVAPGTGPVCAQPFRSDDDLARLRPVRARGRHALRARHRARRWLTELPARGAAARLRRRTVHRGQLPHRGSAQPHVRAHQAHAPHRSPQLWHSLMERLVQHAVASICSQLANGGRAFQLFDSWAGTLSRADYDRFVLPHSQAVFTQLRERAPRRTRHPLRRRLRPPAREHVRRRADGSSASTGAPPSPRPGPAWAPTWWCRATSTPCWRWPAPSPRCAGADAVLADNAGHPGHIFNLGHGVHPPTDPDVLTAVVAHVHERTAR